MIQFPSHTSGLLLRLRWISGFMGGGVRMGGILRLEVCQDGLRVGVISIWSLLLPMYRDFFVPWQEISVTRKHWMIWPIAKIQFGRLEPVGPLTVAAHPANRLARRPQANGLSLVRFLRKPAVRHCGGCFRNGLC